MATQSDNQTGCQAKSSARFYFHFDCKTESECTRNFSNNPSLYNLSCTVGNNFTICLFSLPNKFGYPEGLFTTSLIVWLPVFLAPSDFSSLRPRRLTWWIWCYYHEEWWLNLWKWVPSCNKTKRSFTPYCTGWKANVALSHHVNHSSTYGKVSTSSPPGLTVLDSGVEAKGEHDMQVNMSHARG